MYPEIKTDLQNIFCIKVSLIDLARKLEKDLLIFEHEPRRFTLGFKKDYNLSMSPVLSTPEHLVTKAPIPKELASDRTPEVEELSKAVTEEKETEVFNPSPRQEFYTARHLIDSEGASSMVKQSS